MSYTIKPPFKYDNKGSILKRWYVEYYIYSERDQKLIRKKEYGGINRIKDPTLRKKALEELLLIVKKRLSRGELYVKKKEKLSALKAMQLVLQIKSAYLEERGVATNKYHLNSFSKFLVENKLSSIDVSSITRSDITSYLNSLLERGLSKRSWNNAYIALRAAFNLLIREEKLGHNPCSGIKMLRSKTDTHMAFSESELIRMKAWLDLNDPYLGLFCKFIGYAFLRPTEIMRLKVRNIDLDSKLITLRESQEKTGKKKIKLIQDVLWEDIQKMNLRTYPSDYFLFGSDGHPSQKKCGKGLFSDRFKKMKNELCLSDKQTMYGIRHTYVAMLLEGGAKLHHVMGLTGHESIASFEKYARSILGAPKFDLSEKYTIRL